MDIPGSKPSTGHFVKLTLLTWFAMIGFDFLVHGGVLAKWYITPSPFLLPPERAFVLIPVGYLSFLCLAILLVWLIVKLGIKGWRKGAVFGLMLGALIWASYVLGLISISTAPLNLMAAWFIGQTIELGIAGIVAGSGMRTKNLRGLFVKVFVFALISLATTILLQNLGIAPAIKVN